MPTCTRTPGRDQPTPPLSRSPTRRYHAHPHAHNAPPILEHLQYPLGVLLLHVLDGFGFPFGFRSLCLSAKCPQHLRLPTPHLHMVRTEAHALFVCYQGLFEPPQMEQGSTPVTQEF